MFISNKELFTIFSCTKSPVFSTCAPHCYALSSLNEIGGYSFLICSKETDIVYESLLTSGILVPRATCPSLPARPGHEEQVTLGSHDLIAWDLTKGIQSDQPF